MYMLVKKNVLNKTKNITHNGESQLQLYKHRLWEKTSINQAVCSLWPRCSGVYYSR